MITKRGFEYIIQNNEPEIEDKGIEVLEENEEGFEAGEYSLNVRELYTLESGKEDWEETTIWWFRAVAYDGEEKLTGEWMKNVPDVETKEDYVTDLVLNAIPRIQASGEITSKNANEIQQRGFRIIKEYKGNLLEADYYTGTLSSFKVIDELVKHTVLGGLTGYEVIGYYWTGKFYRDAVEASNKVEEYEMTLGGGMSGEGFGKDLLAGDVYLVQAMAKNELGWGYGELVEMETLPAIAIDVTDDQISDSLFEKTVTLGDLGGHTANRVGIRLGRTKSCNELHYFQNGTFSSHASVKFIVELEPNSKYYIMPYIVMKVDGVTREIPGMLNYTNPDNEQEYLDKFPIEILKDIEEKQFIVDSGNYNYRTIKEKITCEKVGEQGLIDYYGRRRSHTVNNHLIQSKNVCCNIASDYVDKYQRLKLKVAIDTPLLIPFEQEDVILMADSKTPFKETGTVQFKTKGELTQQPYIIAKVRKIDINYTGINADVKLELEV